MSGNQGANGLAGQVAVVTGASSGIGQYTALGLAERGATVVITARNAARLADTAGWLRARAPAGSIETEQVDFASLASVRSLAERIAARHPRLAILVNNAGMVTPSRTVTVDGYEAIFQINHLAPFLLTHLLLPSVKAAAVGQEGLARIVTVASDAAKNARVDFDDLQMAKGWGPLKVYGRSKLMNIMFTYALARRLAGSGVTANCVHPGFVATRIGNKGGLYDLFWAALKPLAISPAKGAETSLYAATAPEMAGVSGQYFYRKKPARSNDLSHDVAAGERLWRISAEMVGIPA